VLGFRGLGGPLSSRELLAQLVGLLLEPHGVVRCPLCFLGVLALAGLRKYDAKGILVPALLGILLNAGLLTAFPSNVMGSARHP
jgi:hypothetical protein